MKYQQLAWYLCVVYFVNIAFVYFLFFRVISISANLLSSRKQLKLNGYQQMRNNNVLIIFIYVFLENSKQPTTKG